MQCRCTFGSLGLCISCLNHDVPNAPARQDQLLEDCRQIQAEAPRAPCLQGLS